MNSVIRPALLCLAMVTILASQSATANRMDPEVAQRLYRILVDDNVERKLERITRLSKQMRRRPTQQAYVVIEHASLLFQEKRLAEAREVLELAIAPQKPGYFPPIDLALGRVLLASDEIDAALVVFERWRSYANRPEPQGLFLLGYVYVLKERFTDAVLVLESLQQTGEKMRRSWRELMAYAYLQNDQFDKAIEMMHALVDETPGEARQWKRLSAFYQFAGDASRGTAALSITDEIGDTAIRERRYLARLFGYLGIPHQAANLLETLIEDSDKPYEDLKLLGRLRLRAREYESALQALHRANEFADNGDAWLAIAAIHLRRENYAEASLALDQANIAYKEEVPPNVFYLQALTAINLDDPDRARERLGQLEGNEDYARRVNNLLKFLAQVEPS